MGSAAIDLSAGMVPKSGAGPAIDLSAGLMPKTQAAPAPAPVVRLAVPAPPSPQWFPHLSDFNPMHPIDNLKSNLHDMVDYGKGILKSVPDTLADFNDLTRGGALAPIGSAQQIQTRGAQVSQDLHRLATPTNSAQAGGKVFGNMAQFVAPGGAEELAAEKAATTLAPTVARLAPRAVPLVAPLTKLAARSVGSGAVNKLQGGSFVDGAAMGAAGDMLGQALPEVAPGVWNAIKNPVDTLLKPLRANLDETIPGTSITPRMRYDAAQRLGVNLDLADATNSGPAQAVKHFNRDSLVGSGVYDKAKANNLAALGNSTDEAVTNMSPLNREAGGVQLQNDLKAHHEALKADSDAGHGLIDQQYGDRPIANPGTISGEASSIANQNARGYTQFPSLKPGKVAAIVDDAQRFGVSDLNGAEGPASSHEVPTVSDALRARSGIMDVYRNNPDLVKTSSDAQLQRLVGATHSAIMDSLPEDAQGTLRNAQLSFKAAKEYDNPSSPLYDAVRTSNPSSKVTGIGPATPENIRDLRTRVSPDGLGVVQRGVAEKALGTDPGTGGYNFRTFPQAFSRIEPQYASELFGAKHLGPLSDVSSTAQALSKDLNPSGTAKQGQKVAEAFSMLPTGGAPLLQYPLARLMNSPRLIARVMQEAPAADRLTLPAASAPLAPAAPLIRMNGIRR